MLKFWHIALEHKGIFLTSAALKNNVSRVGSSAIGCRVV